jgi:hypothetical protein
MMCRDIERYGGLNSHIRDNMDFQSIYQRKSILLFFFFQSSYADVPRMDYLYHSYFGHARCRTQHPPKVLGLAAQPYLRILGMVTQPDLAAIHPGGHTLLWFWSKFTAGGFALSSQSYWETQHSGWLWVIGYCWHQDPMTLGPPQPFRVRTQELGALPSLPKDPATLIFWICNFWNNFWQGRPKKFENF